MITRNVKMGISIHGFFGGGSSAAMTTAYDRARLAAIAASRGLNGQQAGSKL
jgi:hypothetical protein